MRQAMTIDEESTAARAAAHELRRLTRVARVLPVFLCLVLMLSLGQIAFVLLVYFTGQVDDLAQHGEYLVIYGVYSILILGGIWQSKRHPFGVALSVAIASSIEVFGFALMDRYSIIHMVIALLLWGLFFAVARMDRLTRRHPKLYLSRRVQHPRVKEQA